MNIKVYNILTDGNVVRLTGTNAQNLGRVEVLDKASNQWGTICYNDISSNSYYLATSICKSLGNPGYRTSRRGRDFPNITLSANSPIVTGAIRCSYDYYYSKYAYINLYHCSNFELLLGMTPSRCTSDEEWILSCTCKFTFYHYNNLQSFKK